MAPHDAVDERRVALVGPAAQERQGRGLGAESQGAHGVHDEVDPQHHHGVEGRLVPADGTQERQR